MKKVLLASVALLAISLGSASAADAVEEVVVDVPAGFSWTGAYVGIQAGYGWGDVDRLNDTGFANSYDADGFLGGVHVGYNHQFSNNVVVGVEGDIEWAGLDGDDNGVGGTVDGVDFNWTGSLRARLGYAIDRVLVYGTGGVAIASVDNNNNSVGAINSIQETYTGWTVGGGVEYAFTDNLTTRIEYRYSDFGSHDLAPGGGLTSFNNDITSHSVRVGLSYKF